MDREEPASTISVHSRIVVRPQEISNHLEVDPAARMPGHER